jgi:hypothetical protein
VIVQFSWLDRAIQITWAINLVAFAVVAALIGGDALNGHESAGRYYLSNHGTLTEVTYGVFVYSKVHAIGTSALQFLVPFTLIRAWYRGRHSGSV